MTETLVSQIPTNRNSVQHRWMSCKSLCTLHTWMPILTWLPKYNLRWLQMDIIAGITVGLTTVPQALAYAEVAGLPVEVSTVWSLASMKP